MENPKEDLVCVLARAELGRLGVTEFEQWIYANESLPTLVGPDDYLSLIEIDYRHKYSLMEACVILNKYAEQGHVERTKVKQLFLVAGANPNSVYPAGDFLGDDSQCDVAICSDLIIARFGGIHIKEDIAMVDVRFQRRKDADSVVGPWRERVGILHAVGYAVRDHIILYVGRGAQLYFFTDPDTQLYEGGPFWDGLATLLLQIREFGSAISPERAGI